MRFKFLKKMKNLKFYFCSLRCRSQDENGENKSRFIKTKSLREKFRDSRPWTNLRKSAEKEIPSPAPQTPVPNAAPASTNSGPEQTATEGRLSRLFSLRRSVGPSKSFGDISLRKHNNSLYKCSSVIDHEIIIILKNKREINGIVLGSLDI